MRNSSIKILRGASKIFSQPIMPFLFFALGWMFYSLLWAPGLCLGESLLEDFSSRRLNGDGGALFDAYLGENTEQTVTYPGSDPSFPLGGKTLQVNVGGGGHPMVYMHFFPRSGGYSYPQGYAQTYVKNGTWDTACNRMTLWFKSTSPVPASIGGTFQIGTYIRAHGNSDSSWQGVHYYHLFAGSVPANKWVKCWINRTPQHQVGGNPSTNWGDDPEWTAQGVHYFDGLTRWYFDGAYTSTADTSFQFALVSFSTVSGEPDDEVSTVSVVYDGARYSLGFDGLKNTPRTYNIRYSTTSMRVNGFASGTSGGVVSNPGSDYCGVSWSGPDMAEASPGMYFAIQPTNGSAFTEVYLENLSSSNSAPPARPKNLRLR